MKGRENFKLGLSKAIAMAITLSAGHGALAATEMFLKVGDIAGEVEDFRHSGESSINSWSWGIRNVIDPVSGAGKVTVDAVTLTKAPDRATPGLMVACADGRHIDRAIVKVRKVGQTALEFYRIVLENVQVTSLLENGAIISPASTETVSLIFTRAGVEYLTVLPSGAPGERFEFAWDFIAGSAGGIIFPPTNLDADGDGLPDWWEEQFGLDPTVNDAALDKDGDGATNFEEYQAGTSPADVNQVFRAMLTIGRSEAVLSWPSVAGRTYRILTSGDVDGSFSLNRTVDATSETTSIPVPLDFATQFFRLELAQ